MNLAAFGRRLQTIRKEKKLTAELLSEMCGLSPVFVRQIESGIKAPSIDTFITLCNNLQVQPSYLLKSDLNFKENVDTRLFIKEILALSPQQIELVKSVVRAMINHF